MANISYNQIHQTLDEATMTSILQKIREIWDLLPKGSLTDTERKRYRALDVRNLAFVEDVVRLKNGIGASILPAVLLNDNIDTDLKLFKQLKTLRARVLGLDYLLKDVERIVGHESYGVGLTHYGMYKVSSKVGVPNAKSAVDALEWRFKNQGNRPLEEL
ncbi:MAG: hypothetical protein JJE55_01865 [Flavobacteriaceae bacterium]|nr:hypothetical protein [Flavobacteriaceae bacterium]